MTFEIPGAIWAERINLVGDFNNWDCESLPFRYNHQENWQVEIEVDAGREYRFRYLFDDDQWHDDWHADKCLADPHGGYHSILVAEVPPDSAGPLNTAFGHSTLHPYVPDRWVGER